MTLRKLTSTREYLGDRAPITEAVINLRLADTQQPSIERLSQFAESLRDQYPKQFVQRQMSGELTIEPHKERTSMSSQHRTIGYALVSEDGRNVVQARRDGFSFSRLRPYTSWEQVQRDVAGCLASYTRAVEAVLVEQVSLRYINHIKLPAGKIALDEWFSLRPILPWPEVLMDDFVMRTEIPHPDDPKFVAIVTLGVLPKHEEETTTYLLDIDTRAKVDPGAAGDVWGVLNDLRELKNDMFFGTLTEKTIGRLRS
jgi:uncharacterized protein (TIGR04255 family)